MSVRKVLAQYVGNTLRLPIFGVLEREVNCVVLNPQSEPRAFLPADEAKRLGDENLQLRELLGRAFRSAQELCDALEYENNENGCMCRQSCPLAKRDDACIYGTLEREMRELGVRYEDGD